MRIPLLLLPFLPSPILASIDSNPIDYICAICTDLKFTGDVNQFGNITFYSDKTKTEKTTLVLDPETCEEKYCAPNTLDGTHRVPDFIPDFVVDLSDGGVTQSIGRKVGDVLGETEDAENAEDTDDPLDIRIVKGYGSKGYDAIRLTVITHNTSSVIVDPKQFDFGEQFRYVWDYFRYDTKMLAAKNGEVTEFEINLQDNIKSNLQNNKVLQTLNKKKKISFSLPKPGAPVTGLLMSDPCISLDRKYVQQLCACGRGVDWQLSERLPKLINAFGGSDANINYWGLLGDNYYDRDGQITDYVYNGRLIYHDKDGSTKKLRTKNHISLETKSKLFLSVVGNHDYWAEGAPIRGTTEDQCGTGYVQFYGVDTVSGKNTTLNTTGKAAAPWDLSIDPRTPQPYKMHDGTIRQTCSPTKRENTFFYYSIGNVGFIGYSGKHSWEEQRSDFEEACMNLWGDENVDLLMLVGHWNKQGAGTHLNTDVQNTTRVLAQEVEGCKQFFKTGRMTFSTGHEHCNHPVVINDPFSSSAGKTKEETNQQSNNTNNSTSSISSSSAASQSAASQTGFLIGSFGMDDSWSCPDRPLPSFHSFGMPIFDTREELFRVWYFPIIVQEHKEDSSTGLGGLVTDTPADDARYEKLMECMAKEKTWLGCTHLAELWHSRELKARNGESRGKGVVLEGKKETNDDVVFW